MKNTPASSCKATQPLANGKARNRQNVAQKLTYGRHAEQRPVGRGGNDVFFAQQLDAVGRRLQPAEPAAHPRRPQPVLNPRRDLPLQPDEHGRRADATTSSSTHCTSAAMV